jgi:hypothetical protein
VKTREGDYTVTTQYGSFTAKDRDMALHLAILAERREKQRQYLLEQEEKKQNDAVKRCLNAWLNL